MSMRILRKIFLGFFVFCYASCFGGADMRGSVESYKHGTVYTKGGQFRVGKLPPPWVQKKFKYRALLFTHPDYQASIGVDAFCKGSFDDGPLHILTNQLFYGMKALRTRDVSRVVLDDREARRTIMDANLDGTALTADVVVLKMHQCIFDFFYIAKPATYAKGVHDFENFFSGFHYVSGPPLDD